MDNDLIFESVYNNSDDDDIVMMFLLLFAVYKETKNEKSDDIKLK